MEMLMRSLEDVCGVSERPSDTVLGVGNILGGHS